MDFEFIEKLSSKSPTPGGGGVSALIGSLGTALGGMVCNLTIGKKKYEIYEEEVKEILDEVTYIQKRLFDLIKEDEDNFIPLSKAYSLPSSTDEEKKIKKETMQSCLKKASEVPLEVIRISNKAIKLHERLLGKSTILAISDIGVGIQCLRASVLSSKLNVIINIKDITDTNFVKKVEDEMNFLVDESIKICDRVYEEVLSSMK